MKDAPRGAPGPSVAPPASPDPAQRNVETVARLEQTAQTPRSFADRLIDTITGFVGSLSFVYLHLVGFAFWIALNVGTAKRQGHPIDPFPFPLLALFLGMEAILLATLILIGQNRQRRLADRRAHLDLQINMLAEQEATKILEILEEIQRHLGIGGHDPEVAALKQATEPEQLMVRIEQQAARLEEG